MHFIDEHLNNDNISLKLHVKQEQTVQFKIININIAKKIQFVKVKSDFNKSSLIII